MELKQLTDQQAQLKPDGLRNDADRSDFFNQVQNWRQKSIDAINEKDPYKKSLAQSQAQQAYMQAQATVAKSKAAGVKDNAFQQFAMNTATRHQLTDDAVQKGLKNANLGVNDPNYINDYSTLQRAPDYTAFDKRNKELYTTRMNGAVEQDQLGKPITVAGNTMTPWSKVRQINPTDLAHDIMNEATFKPDYAVALEAKYPDLYANAKTPDDFHVAHAQAALRLANEQELQKTVNTGYFPAKDTDAQKFALHAKERVFDQAHPTSTTLTNQLPTPMQHNYVAPMINQGLPAVKKFLDLAPSTQFRPGEKPVPTEVNGYHVITIPDQVELKKNGADIIKSNKQTQKDYEDGGGKEGGFLGIGAKKVKWEDSQAYKELMADEENNPYKVIKQGDTVTLNPKDPVDYNAKAAELADRLKIPTEKINSQVGGTGKHGVNQDIQKQLNNPAKPQQQPKEDDNTPIQVKLPNGRMGHIPLKNYMQFKKDNPGAQRIQ